MVYPQEWEGARQTTCVTVTSAPVRAVHNAPTLLIVRPILMPTGPLFSPARRHVGTVPPVLHMLFQSLSLGTKMARHCESAYRILSCTVRAFHVREFDHSINSIAITVGADAIY